MKFYNGDTFIFYAVSHARNHSVNIIDMGDYVSGKYAIGLPVFADNRFCDVMVKKLYFRGDTFINGYLCDVPSGVNP